MGIFRRRTAGTPKTHNFDLFRSDQALRSAYIQAVQGSWQHLDPFLDSRRDGWLVGELFGSDRSAIPTRVLAAWAAAAPSGRSLAFHGRALGRDAWAIRGRGYGRDVDAIAWAPFSAPLEEAERVLWQAVDVAPGSADPWIGLIVTARGLSLGRDEVVHRFNQAHGRDRFRPDACAQAMQGLCAKWFGSDDEMFGFARWDEAEAPADSAARMVLPMAHIERLVAASREGINGQTERPWLHQGDDIVGRYRSVSEARLLETHLYPW